jgi:hypothetical protein
MNIIPRSPWNRYQRWSPNQLASLAYWGAADRETSYANHDPVTVLHDQSGHGRDAHAPPGQEPEYRTAILGERPGLLYDQAADTRLDINNFTLGTFTIALMVELDSDAAILIQHGPGGGGEGHYLWGDTGDTLNVKRTLTSAKDDGSHWAYEPPIPHAVVHEFDGTHAGNLLRVDGAPVSLVNAGATDDPGTAPLTLPLHLGGRGNDTLSCTGYLFEIVVCTPILAADDRALLEGYLLDRWHR